MRALRDASDAGRYGARESSESPMGHQKSLGNIVPEAFLLSRFTTERAQLRKELKGACAAKFLFYSLMIMDRSSLNAITGYWPEEISASRSDLRPSV